MPFVSVAPVFDVMPHLAQAGQENQIRTNGFAYLVPLTHPTMTKDGQLWVADLRLEYPLEKSALVGLIPIEAFAADPDYTAFAEKLAWRRNRPAIDARVRELVTAPLGEALRLGRISHEPIVEMRLRCAPSWDRVDRAKLHALVRDGTRVKPVEDQFGVWEEVVNRKLPRDLTLLPTEIIERAKFSYVASLETMTVDYSDVSD